MGSHTIFNSFSKISFLQHRKCSVLHSNQQIFNEDSFFRYFLSQSELELKELTTMHKIVRVAETFQPQCI